MIISSGWRRLSLVDHRASQPHHSRHDSNFRSRFRLWICLSGFESLPPSQPPPRISRIFTDPIRVDLRNWRPDRRFGPIRPSDSVLRFIDCLAPQAPLGLFDREVPRSFFDRLHLIRPDFSESLLVEVLDVNRKGGFPRFLIVVGHATESAGVHAKLPSHLYLCV